MELPGGVEDLAALLTSIGALLTAVAALIHAIKAREGVGGENSS